jgi:tetratricopeptide (TPR) repeat protein
LTGLSLVGCGEGGQKVDAAREAEWAWLVDNKAKLDSVRQEVTELEESIKAAPTEEEAETEGEEEGAVSVADLEQQLEGRREEAETLADTLMQRLVGYLNAEPMIEGEPLTESQLAAIRMKSDEDMVLAREYIEKGGDYRRAIDIYQTALQLDPENEELMAALESAKEDRYVSEERFAAVKDGMTQDDVRAALGPVNLHNIREYPDRNVEAWFYPTAEGGYAAAVWFRENKRSGDLVVYQLKYNAVSPEQPAEG